MCQACAYLPILLALCVYLPCTADGTVSLRDVEWSEDGSLVAYQLSSGGSDWSTMHVMSVPPGGEGAPVPLPDELQYIKFSSTAWTHDSKGFFYNRWGVLLGWGPWR